MYQILHNFEFDKRTGQGSKCGQLKTHNIHPVKNENSSRKGTFPCLKFKTLAYSKFQKLLFDTFSGDTALRRHTLVGKVSEDSKMKGTIILELRFAYC